MKKWGFVAVFLGLVLGSLAFPVSSRAITIEYVATDLADSTVGEDLWQYTYYVSGHNFLADNGFAIYFDYTQFKSIQDPPPSVNADWDVIALQPQPSPFLQFDGIYDAYAWVDNASLSDPFRVDFVWMGAGDPGSQLFDLYEYDYSSFSFNYYYSGYTVPLGGTAPVPEPSSFVLMGCALLVGVIVRKRHSVKKFEVN